LLRGAGYPRSIPAALKRTVDVTQQSPSTSNRSVPERICRATRIALPFLPVLLFALLPGAHAASFEHSFDDPIFRRCVNWMLDGSRGALIDNICIDEYDIPPPSLFICARKVRTGFQSADDRDGCALLFEEQARKVRAGYVK
jgi:hypothetical protein